MTDERPVQTPPGPRRRGGDGSRIFWGLVLVAIGAWFFLERTLRIDLPAIPWDDLWPVLLIALGAWVILRGASRRAS